MSFYTIRSQARHDVIDTPIFDMRIYSLSEDIAGVIDDIVTRIKNDLEDTNLGLELTCRVYSIGEINNADTVKRIKTVKDAIDHLEKIPYIHRAVTMKHWLDESSRHYTLLAELKHWVGRYMVRLTYNLPMGLADDIVWHIDELLEEYREEFADGEYGVAFMKEHGYDTTDISVIRDAVTPNEEELDYIDINDIITQGGIPKATHGEVQEHTQTVITPVTIHLGEMPITEHQVDELREQLSKKYDVHKGHDLELLLNVTSEVPETEWW